MTANLVQWCLSGRGSTARAPLPLYSVSGSVCRSAADRERQTISEGEDDSVEIRLILVRHAGTTATIAAAAVDGADGRHDARLCGPNSPSASRRDTGHHRRRRRPDRHRQATAVPDVPETCFPLLPEAQVPISIL